MGITAKAQTITLRNNTNCDLMYDYACLATTSTPPCTSTGSAPSPLPPGGMANIPTSPPCNNPSDLVFHVYFAGTHCSVYDPFIGHPTNLCGKPSNDVIQGQCGECKTAYVNYQGGWDWTIDP